MPLSSSPGRPSDDGDRSVGDTAKDAVPHLVEEDLTARVREAIIAALSSDSLAADAERPTFPVRLRSSLCFRVRARRHGRPAAMRSRTTGYAGP